MTERQPCEMCGVGYHRYGTTDPEHEWNGVGCINTLKGELAGWIQNARDWSKKNGELHAELAVLRRKVERYEAGYVTDYEKGDRDEPLT